MCIDGGTSLHSSHRQLKQWVWEVNAAEPPVESRKLLKWSSTPIIFDIEDHPNLTTAVGCLPLLVSPTIRNLKVTKLLVDDGAGLNLISPKVISKLQIVEEELKVTGTFQGVNPGRSHPKGKITLPVKFGGEFNYRDVGFRVPAKPLRFKHRGAHEDLSLPDHVLSLTAISKLSSTNPQHKRHEIYTGLGHRCGVIPYSSVVWWIAPWAEDE